MTDEQFVARFGFKPEYAAAPSQTASSWPTSTPSPPIELGTGYHERPAVIVEIPEGRAWVAGDHHPPPWAVGLELAVGIIPAGGVAHLAVVVETPALASAALAIVHGYRSC